MAVNTRTEYALRALLEISGTQPGSVSAQQICQRQQLPKKYIEHLLSALKSAGLVSSSAGSKGGYALARKAEQISLQDVMDAVGDRSQELGCDMDKQYCLGSGCGLMYLFQELSSRQRELFRSYTLDKIAGLKPGEAK